MCDQTIQWLLTASWITLQHTFKKISIILFSKKMILSTKFLLLNSEFWIEIHKMHLSSPKTAVYWSDVYYNNTRKTSSNLLCIVLHPVKYAWPATVHCNCSTNANVTNIFKKSNYICHIFEHMQTAYIQCLYFTLHPNILSVLFEITFHNIMAVHYKATTTSKILGQTAKPITWS